MKKKDFLIAILCFVFTFAIGLGIVSCSDSKKPTTDSDNGAQDEVLDDVIGGIIGGIVGGENGNTPDQKPAPEEHVHEYRISYNELFHAGVCSCGNVKFDTMEAHKPMAGDCTVARKCVSCNYVIAPTGQHVAAGEWSSNLVEHWQVCGNDNCNEILNIADHTYDANHVCIDCGFNANADLEISTAEELYAFADLVNTQGISYNGKTVTLLNDIDLNNQAWTPIGQTGATTFLGLFDGNERTIKNLYVENTDTSKNCASGLFGWVEIHGTDNLFVKDLTIDGATVKGHHNVGVIAGYLIGTIDNCHVKNAAVVCTHANDDACGDKVGIIAGIAAETNAVIKNSSATDSTVQGGRDAGQIVGACIVGVVENCQANNVIVTATDNCTGANVNNALIGRTN